MNAFASAHGRNQQTTDRSRCVSEIRRSHHGHALQHLQIPESFQTAVHHRLHWVFQRAFEQRLVGCLTVLGNSAVPGSDSCRTHVSPSDGAGMNSLRFMGPQSFAASDTSPRKGCMQPSLYGRPGYPGETGYAGSYPGGPVSPSEGMGLPSHSGPLARFTQPAATAVAVAAATATIAATATVAALQERQSQEHVGAYAMISAPQPYSSQYLTHSGARGLTQMSTGTAVGGVPGAVGQPGISVSQPGISVSQPRPPPIHAAFNAQSQCAPQHGYLGGRQPQQLPGQGLKRPYVSE
ncbi:zinc finger MIZ domain-containing protein 1-like, partial [Chiloscyllium plagiosum]|uniref:zinc finger MIZ domain-containing protein 1-like n=1 Tax=Chiloscyllium plagiosum TaxID=36176 RepID=UPI001CB7E6B2